MKRLVACLLAAALVFTQSLSAYALQNGSEAQENGGGKKSTGQVDVSIGPALILDRAVTFTVGLTGQASQTITLAADREEQTAPHRVSFEGLTAGDYQLTVSGPGFAAYSQTISVDEQVSSVQLLTGFVEGLVYQEGTPHPGVLLIGDVNGDGVVDEADRKALTDAIDAENYSEAMDLNGDGRTDLVDLDYFARGYQIKENILAQVEKSIPAAVIEASAGANTKVEGNLTALLKKEGNVVLTPENGGEISADCPVSLDFELSADSGLTQADGIVIETSNDNPISRATVAITYIGEDGQENIETALVESGVHHLLKDSSVLVKQDARGNIQIHLGTQIAVKKVTLTILGMQKNNNLAEISRVEFVNGMEDRIPEPSMDIPENLTATVGSKTFTLTWDHCVNVTGYEVLIEQGDSQETQRVAGNSLTVTSFGGKDLVNKTEYQVRVQAVNGTWRSGYSDPITVVPKASKRPDKPDRVSATGKYQSVAVSWKMMEDTDSYNLFYKETQAETYQKIEGITLNSYTISGLKDRTEYTVYVTGVNELGESDPSLSSLAQTTDLQPAVMPRYKIINNGAAGEKGAHIISATQKHGTMTDSPLDTVAGTAWGTVDHDPASYYLRNSWDDGGFNALGSNGLTYEFDQAYRLETIALQEIAPQSLNYSYARIRYWDESGKEFTLDRGQTAVQRKLDAEQRPYYLLRLPETITVKKIQIGLARYLASGTITVSEVYFYHYDSLEDDIMALYEDDLHTVLKAEVTQETIDELRQRINTPDEVSGEYHPDRDILERELKNAEDILNNIQLCAPVLIHNSITTSDVNRGFGGLNAWQPLGITAAAGDSITLYVGHNSKRTGDNTNLQLVATQYHSESSPMFKVIATLKVGGNIIEIPRLWSSDAESGGALYIQYTGNSASDRYAVRVSGGVQVPRLDLYQVEDAGERLARTLTYVQELQGYVGRVEALHEQVHKDSQNTLVNRYEYNDRNCILGASDILLDTMMFSLPAQQVLRGAGTGTAEEQAQKIVASLDAMENMMGLFYQHKGLNNSAPAEKDRLPKRHLNIRYQRMFAGAFMYASGAHIGIEWNETAGMMGAIPVESDSSGRYLSGRYFGWGIAHEIGHCINQGTYAVAEITNNYYAQLAQAKDTNTGMRFQYPNIYKKVTSGASGPSSNVATQLGMYWQLHLAYDSGYNYKTYENYEEQLDNLFYARMDTYARDVSRAPAPGDIALTLSKNSDQDLMRLACAAAEKDILEFFERWGKIPDAGTQEYAGQFEKETRAIYYADDDSRVYRLEHEGSSLGTAQSVEAVGEDTTSSISPSRANQVDFQLSAQKIPSEDVLGYEIVRCTISGGEIEKETVGFTTENTFSDYVTTINNRVVSYEVTLIDRYLNRSAVKTLEPLKIEHDGSLDKSFWSLSSTGLTATEIGEAGTGTDDAPCAPKPADPLLLALDQDIRTVYTGVAAADAEVVVEFNRSLVITGFKYTAGEENPVGDYTLLVRSDTGEWLEAASGTLGGSRTVYFENTDKKYVSTYRTTAAKLVIRNQQGRAVSIAELDFLGVTGDNVDFRSTEEGTTAIGRLTANYQYGERPEDFIPAGSIVFTGAYKADVR